MPELSNLPPEAVALTIFREIGGRGRQYTAATFPSNPHAGCSQIVRQATAFGYLDEASADGAAVLDVLNADGDVIHDYTITSRVGVNWLYRRLGLRVLSTDGDAASRASREFGA